jgi:predicted phosphodiesterase
LKLGLFSDIHCNLTGLQRALELLDDGDELHCASDVRCQYRFSGEPDTLSLRLDSADIAMAHKSPWDNVRTASAHYVYPANQADMKRVAQVPADIVVLGHTHQAFSAWVNRTLIVNPGSRGASRDPLGLITCAALDVASREVNVRSFSA